MPATPAPFFWYELITSDVEEAAAFYAKVVGWTVQPAAPGMDYSIFAVGERGVAGLMSQADELEAAGAAPFWIGYIRVDDVDAYVARVVRAGGAERRAAWTVPGVGRMAAVNDPQGALFMLMAPDGPDRPTIDPDTAGLIGWHELMAVEGPTAFGFYKEVFGWTRSTTHDMGPMGSYQLFAAGGADTGGIMTKPTHFPSPFWSFYFNVGSARAAAARVAAAGGLIVNGPMQVPGGDWVLQARDPQGALFALTSRSA